MNDLKSLNIAISIILFVYEHKSNAVGHSQNMFYHTLLCESSFSWFLATKTDYG